MRDRSSFDRAHAVIRGADVVEMVDYALAFDVALDSLPAVRRHAIEVLFARNDYLTSSNLAAALGYPTTTARRTAEDLAALKVLTVNKIGPGKADERQLTEWARAALATVRSALFSEPAPDTDVDILGWTTSACKLGR